MIKRTEHEISVEMLNGLACKVLHNVLISNTIFIKAAVSIYQFILSIDNSSGEDHHNHDAICFCDCFAVSIKKIL